MKKIGGYEVIEKLGEGGMGAVYKGRQVSLDRAVAIKVLSEKLADHNEVLERFKRESLIIARLNHPNIIHVIDRGFTPSGRPYFVMEYIEGNDLARVIREGNFSPNQKLDVIIQVCKALSYAHKNQVIHRDIKPPNVLIDTEGNPLVVDFGIAKFFGSGGYQTQTDMVMGTMAYMSPEQHINTSRVTAATDLYSLGAVMYELFTGVKPLEPFKRPSEIAPTIVQPLEEVILRCLEPDPNDRFTSADEIKERLLKLLQGAHLPTDQKERARRVLAKVEDKFALLDVIKEDRYGAVYLYEDKVDHRLMVIKKQTDTGAGLSEARLLTTLKHKNIVNILGASGNERLFIIVMEYVNGGSLRDRLIRPLPLRDALRTAREICEGLSFVHKNRTVHGNLRPSNILLSDSGEVKITDFGLSEHYVSEEGDENWYNVDGEPKSPRADIFAVGMIFYQMLTGSLVVWNKAQIVPHVNFNRLPVKLQEIVTRLLSRRQDARYDSFDEVIVEIDRFLDDHKKRSKRPAVAATPERATAPPQKIAGTRLVLTILLLALLLFTALVYLDHADYIKMYSDAIVPLWEKLTLYLGSLFQK
jgi:serine/threonine-protein kinase